jgi:hypothetical protein
MARANGHVNGKLIPVLRVNQASILREESFYFSQIAQRASLKHSPGIVTIYFFDAIDVGLRLHLDRLSQVS